jgi:hypothetical protein
VGGEGYPEPMQLRTPITVVVLAGCVLASLAATGCGTGNGFSRVIEVNSRQFTPVVLRADQPVLVNFYKPG